jgi:hypothetical protein
MAPQVSDDLVERAMRVANSGDLGASLGDRLERTQVLEPLVERLYSMSDPWSLRDGQRLSLVRRPLLRLLAPFIERQEELNQSLRVAVVLLADEVRRLQGDPGHSGRSDPGGTALS